MNASIKTTGGRAFPESFSPDYPNKIRGNLTVRDYFAIHADVPWNAVKDGFKIKHGRIPTVSEFAEYAAQIRYAQADAMIAERNK